MSEDILQEIASEIDSLIVSLVEKYKIDPLTMTSVILARLVLTNDYLGSGEGFRKLIATIPDSHPYNPDISSPVH